MRAGKSFCLKKSQATYGQKASGSSILVGQGKLYLRAGLEANTIGAIFQGWFLKRILENGYRSGLADRSLEDWLGALTVVTFTFPRLRWVLGCMAVYILVVGVLNFAVLSGLRRMEWGWVTTSIIAGFFAVGVYVASSASRPKYITLDAVVVNWMDSHSGIASQSQGVESPRRETSSFRCGG